MSAHSTTVLPRCVVQLKELLLFRDASFAHLDWTILPLPTAAKVLVRNSKSSKCSMKEVVGALDSSTQICNFISLFVVRILSLMVICARIPSSLSKTCAAQVQRRTMCATIALMALGSPTTGWTARSSVLSSAYCKFPHHLHHCILLWNQS